MNKSELVNTVAQRTGLSAKDANTVITSMFEVIGETVAKGKEKVTIPGYLSFEQVERGARTARNPQTGETINVPKSKAVKVTAGATLKGLAKGTIKP